MPLFGKPRPEPPQHPHVTINGRPQPHPEWAGGLQRRSRLFFECVRRLKEHPLASPVARGTPIGDGLGLEELVAVVSPLFQVEQSLVRWVALRGAFASLYITTVNPESRVVPFSPVVETAMGVGYVTHPDTGKDVLDVAPEWAQRLSGPQREAAIEVCTAFGTRLFDYDRFSQLPTSQVNSDSRCSLNDAMALDFIAWAAVALLRLGLSANYVHTPEPDALPAPGWYTEPLFAKSERYWNGSDWTDRCRMPDGRGYREVSSPLR